ncbi:cyclic AMP-dependent transcription factor ATF-5 [Amia ocellicauda]|uniref:cyclic AMP-dependent transcription factor ATF-5 n=1 Tax=Amia ocellicauda TaxID=2972642 RepID=UPI00346408FF
MEWTETLWPESLYPELVSLTAEPEMLLGALTGPGGHCEPEGGAASASHSLLQSGSQSISEMDWMGERMDVYLLDSLIEDGPMPSEDLPRGVRRGVKVQAEISAAPPADGGSPAWRDWASDQVAPYTPPRSPDSPVHRANGPYALASAQPSRLLAYAPVRVVKLAYDSLLSSTGPAAPSDAESSECDDRGQVPLKHPAHCPPKILRGGGSPCRVTEATAAPSSANPNRKHKKKEQNKTAATRYRQKQRTKRAVLEGELGELLCRNKALRERLASLAAETRCLRGLLTEIRSAGADQGGTGSCDSAVERKTGDN